MNNGRARSARRLVFGSLGGMVLLYLVMTTVRVVVRGYYYFLPDYIRWTLTPTQPVTGLKHVFLVVTDHFEPNSDPARVKHWADKYVAMAARHRDSAGRPPQH